MGYTPFENYYAKFKRGCDIGDKVIKPIWNITEIFRKMKKTKIENKNNKLFVGTYHNENIMMNLTSKLRHSLFVFPSAVTNLSDSTLII